MKKNTNTKYEINLSYWYKILDILNLDVLTLRKEWNIDIGGMPHKKDVRVFAKKDPLHFLKLGLFLKEKLVTTKIIYAEKYWNVLFAWILTDSFSKDLISKIELHNFELLHVDKKGSLEPGIYLKIDPHSKNSQIRTYIKECKDSIENIQEKEIDFNYKDKQLLKSGAATNSKRDEYVRMLFSLKAEDLKEMLRKDYEEHRIPKNKDKIPLVTMIMKHLSFKIEQDTVRKIGSSKREDFYV